MIFCLAQSVKLHGWLDNSFFFRSANLRCRFAAAILSLILGVLFMFTVAYAQNAPEASEKEKRFMKIAAHTATELKAEATAPLLRISSQNRGILHAVCIRSGPQKVGNFRQIKICLTSLPKGCLVLLCLSGKLL